MHTLICKPKDQLCKVAKGWLCQEGGSSGPHSNIFLQNVCLLNAGEVGIPLFARSV